MSAQKPLYLALAYSCVGLGVVGFLLPIVPATPFLLVAAWAAPKASPALHRWLYRHPVFGSALVAWEEKGAVSTATKWTACALMATSWVLMAVQSTGLLVPISTGALFLGVGAFLATRPAP
jgi:uncharacterized membrane protein YbaN (DUF454 family)